MKKALIITTISGFVPQFEMNNIKILQECGYQIHYASNFDRPVYRIDENELEDKGMILHHVSIRKSPFQIKENVKALRQIRSIIQKEKIQLIHCHNPLGGVVGRLAAKYSGCNPYVIYTAHGFHFYKGAPLKNWIFYYVAEKILARFTDCLITINEEDYERAKKFHLKKNGKVEKIPGVGVDIEKFQKKEKLREKKRHELQIPKGAFHIVSVGELVRNKNHEIIIKALADMKCEDIHYSICGDGPYKEKLERLIEKYQMNQHIRLLGHRTDIEEVLQSADCFIFPSRREGLGIAAVEAMVCEIPVIASDNRGTREYMCHEKNGIVCNPEKKETFGMAIMELKCSKQMRERMAQEGRKTAEKFSVESVEVIMRRIYLETTQSIES